MPQLTRALIYDAYGSIDELHIANVTLPDPKAGEVLIKVHAAALNPKDALVRKGKFRWLSGSKFPKFTGLDFAGVVEKTGEGVDLAVGAPVYGFLNEFSTLRGTVADYVVAKQNECAPMPAKLTFEQAAALPLVCLTSLQALRDLIHLQPGQKIAILGASGGVGTHAIQIAKAMDAQVVTTSSQKNQSFCRVLGADEALDYATDNPFSTEKSYDGIFDVFGRQSYEKIGKALKPQGVFVSTVPSLKLLFDSFKTWFWGPRARFVLVRSKLKICRKSQN